MITTHEELYQVIRRVAKQPYWQAIYAQSKEISNLGIFNNQSNLTYLQLNFLQQLAFYSSLQWDIASNEVSELVLDNEIYEDAYAHYRHTKKRKQMKTPQAGVPVVESQTQTEQVVGKNQWVFTNVKGKS